MIRKAKSIPVSVAVAAALYIPTTVAAQSVVVTGTGDPTIDIPAVQAAVDQGGWVMLKGHFSFDAPPTKPGNSCPGFSHTVLVSKAVAISGMLDDHGEMTSIAGGTIPFCVDAPGTQVTIQGLHFIHPIQNAIHVSAVRGLAIGSNRIEGVVPNPDVATAIGIGTTEVGTPSPSNPGHPENISGTIWITENDIDAGGTAAVNTLGIYTFALGKSPDREVDLYISGNKIRNITERAIDINSIGGRGHVERNVISTGAVVGPAGGLQPNGMNIVASGSFLIAHNSIISEWAAGSGILVQGNPDYSEASAIVVDNDVIMSAPEGTVFGSTSAGIMVAGFAQGNSVVGNRIHGRARAALAVAAKGAGLPGNNKFVSNDLTGFQSSLADLYVDAGITNTIVVGAIGKVEDHGAGTVVVPMPN